MEPITAQRTLVKSPPELWSQLSDAQELARHLGEFGEIRITRLEAERTVAWEGDLARGTVELEPSGWGTRVTLTAESVGSEVTEAEAAPEPASSEAGEPEAAPEPARSEATGAEAAHEPGHAEDGEPHGDGDRPVLSPTALELTVESAALEIPSSDPSPDPDPGPPPDPAPEPGPDPEPPPPRKPSFFARLFGRRRGAETVSDAAHDQSPTDSAPPPEVGPPATAAGQRAYSQDPPLPAESAPEPVDDAPKPVEDDPEPVDDAPKPAEDDPPSVVEAAPARPDPQLEKTAAILETVLDDLGAAHHRPFSRG